MRTVCVCLLLASVVGCLPKAKQKAKVEGKAEQVKAKVEGKPKLKRLTEPVLLDNWAKDWKNTLGAEAMYKGKVVPVVGSVAKVGKSLTGKPVVTLKGTELFGAVRCEFDEPTPALLDLYENQAVIIAGECVSQSRLKNCEIVKVGR